MYGQEETNEIRKHEKMPLEFTPAMRKNYANSFIRGLPPGYPRVPKPNHLEYYPFQEAGIAFATNYFKRSRKALLIGDPPGLGKTIQAAGLINTLAPKNVLVIGPASLRPNWYRELYAWCVDIPIVHHVVSYEHIAEYWRHYAKRRWDLMVIDEAHYIKNPESNRTQAVLALAAHAEHVLLLTGTPAPNRLHELYPLISLQADVINNISARQFKMHFTKGYPTSYGFKVTGARNRDELDMLLRGTGFMLRRNRREVLPQLPEVQHCLVTFDNESEKLKQIIRKEQNMFDIEQVRESIAAATQAAYPEVRHEMGVAKIPMAINWAKSMLESVDKLVLFAYHTRCIELLQEGLASYSPVVMQGRMSAAKQDAVVQKFQHRKECRVFIGQLNVAGTGHTLHAAHHVGFVEFSWVPGENEQGVERVRRIGQTAQQVFAHYLVVDKSVDAQILRTAVGKADDLKATLH